MQFPLALWLGLVGVLFAAQTPAPPIQFNGPADINEAYVIVQPERPLEETARTYAAMRPVTYMPPSNRWANLPRTRALLARGGELRIVMLGDSIVNDTNRSNWSFHLQELYPRLQIIKFTSVRGSTGCTWYREPGRVQRYVLDFKPDLVMIGGISHQKDAEAVRDVIRQIRAASPADILLMTGPFGYMNPNDTAQWQELLHPLPEDYRVQLERVAREEKAEFVDLQRAWGEYVRESGRPIESFRRDDIHANAEGEQIIGRIMLRYFAPKSKLASSPPSRGF